MRNSLFATAISILLLCMATACDKTPADAREGNAAGAPAKVKDKPNLPFTKEGELVFFPTTERKESTQIDIEVANNDFETQQGLMFRQSMTDTQGMLFIFENMEPRSFWMKNTYLSLDIIFVDNQRRVVSIQKNAAPLSERSLPSESPAQYVLEMNGGWSDRYGLKKGDQLDWRY